LAGEFAESPFGVCKRCGMAYVRRGRLQRFCSACAPLTRREYTLDYYVKRREEKLGKAKQWQANNRERYLRTRREYEARKLRRAIPLVIEHYSNGTNRCSCCCERELDFLTIDHIAGNGNRTSREMGTPRGGSELYRWLVRKGFPSGYAVLCANCNKSKANGKLCIHKRSKREYQPMATRL
jgi:hypothetical protein